MLYDKGIKCEVAEQYDGTSKKKDEISAKI